LIKFYNGLDGLKTGFTDNAGYCLTGTMLRNDMRLITVTMKAPTKEDRNTDTINLMEYAYSMYYKSTLIKKDKKIGDMFIDNAKKRKVSYYLKEDASVILDKDVRNIKYNYRNRRKGYNNYQKNKELHRKRVINCRTDFCIYI